jgi:hypothetical protein
MIFGLLLLGALQSTFADTTETNTNDDSGSLTAGALLGMEFGGNQSFVTGGLRIDNMFSRWLGIGIAGKVSYGINYEDLFCKGFIILDLGIIYIGGGISYQLIRSSLPGSLVTTFSTVEKGIHPAFTFGILYYFSRSKNGKYGIDIFVDYYPTIISSTSDYGYGMYLFDNFMQPFYNLKIGFALACAL